MSGIRGSAKWSKASSPERPSQNSPRLYFSQKYRVSSKLRMDGVEGWIKFPQDQNRRIPTY